ncbi:hypothetical protein WR25_11526 [Diploscapter pachys]|uniref:G-protein coupled receptors family 1 profile domain-containing protein n=1 Tax=Diploscapter pachys TaxID=2018661 RepID=A0A2A2JK06_9BILA|nr:hypothetical protein WR25_11526 [Diploscapter pachys]
MCSFWVAGFYNFRHSPFFFLGFVAFFDTLLDATFVLLLSVPVNAQFYDTYSVFLVWIEYLPALHLLMQIFKLSSVFCLVAASIERYIMTRHWTFTGFEQRTRWLALTGAVTLAVFIKKYSSEELIVQELEGCSGFGRWLVGSKPISSGHDLLGLVHTLAISVPFFTLILLNGGIVLMLKKQNQLRSLITELTLGHDVMKMRKKNIRQATQTLIVIITAYLISNLLTLCLILIEYIDRDILHQDHPDLHRLALDIASLLTVIGNVIRFPAHFCSNSDIRQQFKQMLCGDKRDMKSLPSNRMRRMSEKCDNQWVTLLLRVNETTDVVAPEDPIPSRQPLLPTQL